MPVRLRGGERARRLHRAQHAGLGAVARAPAAARAPRAASATAVAIARFVVGVMRACGIAARPARAAETPCSGSAASPGSKADLMRRCWSSSCAVNCTGIRSRFSTPTPCSPVRQPPTSTHSFRMSAPNCSGLVEALRVVGVEHDQRMQVAVAGVEDVGDLQAVAVATSRRCGAARPAAGWSGSRRPCTDSPG